MKQTYISPKLIIHGDIETLTKANDDAPTNDAILVNGEAVPGINPDGSSDVSV